MQNPTRSRDHVVLSILAERRLREGRAAGVEMLLEGVRTPPIEVVGPLPIDEFLPQRERTSLLAALNTLLASSTFESWRMGCPLDVNEWMASRADGRVNATIISAAHLDDEEPGLVLSVVLDQLLGWVRAQPGTPHLRGQHAPTETSRSVELTHDAVLAQGTNDAR